MNLKFESNCSRRNEGFDIMALVRTCINDAIIYELEVIVAAKRLTLHPLAFIPAHYGRDLVLSQLFLRRDTYSL